MNQKNCISAPVRVLQVVGNMAAGGMETLIMNWYRKIDRELVQFDFLVHSSKKGVYDEEIATLGGNIYRCTILEDKNFNKYKQDLNEFFRTHSEYQTIHVHHNALGTMCLKAAYDAHIPCRIAHSHIASFSKTPRGIAKYFITRSFAKYATDLFACSKAAGDYMFGRDADYTVVHNGIDVERFRYSLASREVARRDLNIESALAVIHVGRFFDQKNHTFLIDIFKRIYEKNQKARLLLVGVGPLQPAIMKKVCDFNLQEAVVFLGVRQDVPELLSAGDIFLFPSLYEGLPLTLVEAQASGLPVVCSDTITIETKLTSAYEILALNDNSEKWAQRVLEVYERHTVRSDAYTEIKEKGYDSTDTAMQIQTFYENQRNMG